MNYHVAGSGGIDIAYDVVGDGSPVLLIHGFGANRAITWKNTGWYDALVSAGHKVIALDCRGHGQSAKPHDALAYDEGVMAADAVAVLADAGADEADVMGYSMGAQLAIRLMHDAPGRVRRCVLAGVGENYFKLSRAGTEAIAEALETDNPSAITLPIAREFRRFCERAGDDLKAMAACMRRPRRIFTPDELSGMHNEILVVCGTEDTLSGSPEPLARAFPNANSVLVPRRNHHSTVGDRAYKDAVIRFFADSG
jgi:pimeloyl-ACP methyl ester carboxylesterase